MKVVYEFEANGVYPVLAKGLRDYWKNIPTRCGEHSFYEKRGKLVSLTLSTGNCWEVEKSDNKTLLTYKGSRYGFAAMTPFQGRKIAYNVTAKDISFCTGKGYSRVFYGVLVNYQTSTPPEWGVQPTEIVNRIPEFPELVIITQSFGLPSPWDVRVIRLNPSC